MNVDLTKIKNIDNWNRAVAKYGEERMARQVELERRASERGEFDFLRRFASLAGQGSFDETNAGRATLRTFHGLFTEALEYQLTRKQRGARAAWKNLLAPENHLDSADVAMITLRSLFGILFAAGKGNLTQQVVARHIMRNVEGEMVTREFEKQEPLAVADRMRKAKRGDGASPEQIVRDVKLMQEHRKLHWTPRGFDVDPNVISCGVALIRILEASVPGLIELNTKYTARRHTEVMVTVHSDLLRQIEERNLNLADAAYQALPLVVPPIPWSPDNLIQGGYYTNYIRSYGLVKKTRRLFCHEVQNTKDIEKVLRGVNPLQETMWRINRRVLDVLRTAFNASEDIVPKLPRAELPEPPEFTDKEWEEEPQRCKSELWAHYDECRKLRSQRLQILTLINVAEMVEREPELGFSWTLDSRGRAYPISGVLSPQGSDWNKHLLEFAKGDQVTCDSDMDGIRWAAATHFGQDKLPRAERIQWTHNHLQRILRIAQDPFSDLWWTEADKPAGFLMACFELADYAVKGLEHVTRMPVAVDATCSGLQILSALSRDSVGGRMTNLTASDKRYDIYGEVAEGPFRKNLEAIAAGDIPEHLQTVEKAREFAQTALDYGFTRDLTKRPVMTLSYASTEDSCRRYVRDYYHERIAKDGRPHDQFHLFAVFVGRVLWMSMPEVVVRGLDIMDWLQQVSCAAIKSSKDVPLQWRTPDGLVCRTNRPKEKTVTPLIWIYDHQRRKGKAEVFKLKTQQWLQEEDIRQHRNSASPNYVHSIDGSFMRAVVRRWDSICKQRGQVCQVSMVHDSFATTSKHFTEWNRVIREEFVKLFSQDLLADYEQSMREIAGPDAIFPPRPTMGDLDLTEVLTNEFFFS